MPSSPVEGMPRSRHSPNMSPVERTSIHTVSPIDRPMQAMSPLDAVPPRPLNTHASLLHMQAPNQSQNLFAAVQVHQQNSMDESKRDDSRHARHYQGGYTFAHHSVPQQHQRSAGSAPRASAGHPHSLGSLLNHPAAPHPSSRSHSPASTHLESPRANTRQHISPVIRSAPAHLASNFSTQGRVNGNTSGVSSSPHSVASIIDVDEEYPYEDEKKRSSPPIATLEQEVMERETQRERERGT